MLDPGKGTVVGDAAAGGGLGEKRWVDTVAAKGGFDQGLALLDLARAGLDAGSKGGNAGRTGDQAGGRIARPSDEHHQDEEENCLDGGGKTQATKLRAIVNEQVAVAEERRRIE